MDVKKVAKKWQKSAKDDFHVAEKLFELKHYTQSLFFLHLSIEKMLKAGVILHTKKQAPYIHHLRRLGKLADLTFDNKQKELLHEITSFNMKGRYQIALDEFSKKCTKSYSSHYLKSGKQLFLWLGKKIFPQKFKK